MLTYKKLIKISGRSVQSLKRAAMALFDTDPEVGQAAGRGRVREFSVDDAFLIYLVSVMVTDNGMRLEEAVQHTWGIFRFLDSINLFPSTLNEKDQPQIVLMIYAGFYEFRIYEFDSPRVEVTDWNLGEERVEERYVSRWVPVTAIDNRWPGPKHIVTLSYYLKTFVKAVGALG